MGGRRFEDWLLGRSPKQLGRWEEMADRPLRWAVIQGTIYGFVIALLYLVTGAGIARAAAIGLVSGAIFGPVMAVGLYRRNGGRPDST